jgi:hypothetical protein
MLFIAFGGACILQSVCALDVDASFLNISASNGFFQGVRRSRRAYVCNSASDCTWQRLSGASRPITLTKCSPSFLRGFAVDLWSFAARGCYLDWQRDKAFGGKIMWTYSPGKLKVVASPDGLLFRAYCFSVLFCVVISSRCQLRRSQKLGRGVRVPDLIFLSQSK